jgi:hypothetical protein
MFSVIGDFGQFARTDDEVAELLSAADFLSSD